MKEQMLGSLGKSKNVEDEAVLQACDMEVGAKFEDDDSILHSKLIPASSRLQPTPSNLALVA